MLLSRHFSLEEMAFSLNATQEGLSNDPPEVVKNELIRLCEMELEQVRTLANSPVTVISGYRSPEVNTLAKGSKSSQHCKGQAADIRVAGRTTQELFDLISASSIRFDQLIQEYNSWVHISRSDKPRRQRLYATKVNGESVYTPA